LEKLVPAQTSVPDWLMTYARQIADVHYSRRLNRMYVHMLQGFLAYEPWKANPPLPWRVARIHRSASTYVRKGSDLGWVPMNMVLPTPLVEQIKNSVEIVNINSPELTRMLSVRTFLYTAVVWWVTSVYPYKGPGLLENNNA
jgi:hypothetical protein